MSTPKDRERSEAFRDFVAAVGGPLNAQALLLVGTRSLDRMIRGKKPPPGSLLEECAACLTDRDWPADEVAALLLLAARLRDAATPAGAPDA